MPDHTLSPSINAFIRFYRCLDRYDHDRMLELVTDDIAWDRQGKALRGKQAVRDALAQRPATMRIRHLLTNVEVTHATDVECRLSAYMLIIRHDSGAALTGPAPLEGIESVRTTHAELVRGQGGWLLRRIYSDDVAFLAQEGR